LSFLLAVSDSQIAIPGNEAVISSVGVLKAVFSISLMLILYSKNSLTHSLLTFGFVRNALFLSSLFTERKQEITMVNMTLSRQFGGGS